MELAILARISVSEITKTRRKPTAVLGCVRNFAAREKIKSLEEVQAKDSTVLAKISDIKVKRQRGQSEETEERQAAKEQKRLDRVRQSIYFASASRSNDDVEGAVCLTIKCRITRADSALQLNVE
jgi:hypothetical protein